VPLHAADLDVAALDAQLGPFASGAGEKIERRFLAHRRLFLGGVGAEIRALDASLARIQNELFHLGSDLCLPEADKASRAVPRIEARHVEALEAEIDRMVAELGPLANFILPGGSVGGAQLHVARTICRRAERRAVALAREEPVGAHVVAYLNRLSDALFVMARWENRYRGVTDPVWDTSA